MKTVKLKDNIVAEIIPEYALPVEKWYGADFAAQCVEASDEVEQLWVYDPEVGDPEGGIAAGTAFEDIPDDWVCPLCGVGKDDFSVVEE